MGAAPSRVLDRLWLGAGNVVKCEPPHAFFSEQGVTHIVSLGSDEPAPGLRARLGARERCLHIAVSDVPEAKLADFFERIVRFMHEARAAGGCVYVHCHQGVSRSSSSVCAYLMAALGVSLVDALQYTALRRRIACPNPGFVEQLARWEVERADALTRALRERHYPADRQLVERDLLEIARSGLFRAPLTISQLVNRGRRAAAPRAACVTCGL